MPNKSKSDTIIKANIPERTGPEENSPFTLINNPSTDLKASSQSRSVPSNIGEKHQDLKDDDIFCKSAFSKTYDRSPNLPDFMKLNIPYEGTENASWVFQSVDTITQVTEQGYLSNKSYEELSEIASALSAELYYCLNQNLILNREITYARTVLRRERGNLKDIDELNRKAIEGKWMGRQEIILRLKEKIHTLTRMIEHSERNPCLKFVEEQADSDDDELSQEPDFIQLAFMNEFSIAELEKERVINDQQQLKEKLEYYTKMNDDLVDEANYLRKEIAKNSANAGGDLNKELRELKLRIRYCLNSKSQLVKSVSKEESLTYKHLNEISKLKNQIRMKKEMVAESERILVTLKSNEMSMHRVFDDVKCNIIENASQTIQQLESMVDEYRRRLNHLRFLINSGPSGVSTPKRSPKQLTKPIILSKTPDSQKYSPKIFNRQTKSPNQNLQSLNNKGKCKKVLRFRSPLTSEIECPLSKFKTWRHRPSLFNIFHRTKTLFDKSEDQNLDRSVSIYIRLRKIRNIVQQLQDKRSALYNILAKVKALNGSYKQLCEYNTGLSSAENKGKSIIANPKLQQGAKILLNALKQENKFLTFCIDRVFQSKEEDLDFLITGTSEIENSFRNGLCS